MIARCGVDLEPGGLLVGLGPSAGAGLGLATGDRRVAAAFGRGLVGQCPIAVGEGPVAVGESLGDGRPTPMAAAAGWPRDRRGQRR